MVQYRIVEISFVAEIFLLKTKHTKISPPVGGRKEKNMGLEMTKDMDLYCDEIHHDCQRCEYEGMCPRELDYIAVRIRDAREAAERRENKFHDLISDLADLARQQE